MNSHSRLVRFVFVIFSTLVLLASSCTSPSRPNQNETQPSPSKRSSPTRPSTNSSSPAPSPLSQVSQRNATVTVTTPQQTSTLLTDNAWHDLHDGDRIATDTNGEAEVSILNCMRVYVFKNSQLVRATCPKAAYQSGSVACAAAGTSLFNNSCSNKVIVQTDTAELSVEGTYFSVTYLPTEQLTLVSVLEGKVNVRPTIDEGTSAASVELTQGNFLIVIPEEKKAVFSNLDSDVLSGKPVPLDRLRGIAVRLKLEPAFSRIGEQARADGIAVVSTPTDAISANQSMINCDCENVSAGLLTRQYQQQCREVENRLREQLTRTGNVTGKCDAVASGPNARPK